MLCALRNYINDASFNMNSPTESLNELATF